MQLTRGPALPVHGTTVFLQPTPEIDSQHILGPDGTPALNYTDPKYDDSWVLRRVLELIALYDDPIYSFFRNVAEMTKVEMRTTPFHGQSAVQQLVGVHYHEAESGIERDDRGEMRFWHRFRHNTDDASMDQILNARKTRENLDWDDPKEYERAQEFVLQRRMPHMSTKPPAKPVPPQPRYPVVGNIGAPITKSRLPSSPMPPRGFSSGLMSGEPIPLPSMQIDVTSHAANVAPPPPPPGTLPPPPPGVSLLPNRATRLPSTESTDDPAALAVKRSRPGGPVVAEAANANANLRGPEAGTYAYNVEMGDETAARRLTSGIPLSDADFKMWLMLYNKGEGAVRPARHPVTDPSDVRQRQMADINDFVDAVADAKHAHLHWRMLPEHLRILFLTETAAMALEHAAWFAHYQQPWDGTTLPIQTARQAVPTIDLMTHEMVRVPFQTLVAHIIFYWRALRMGDPADRNPRSQVHLDAINGVILTMSNMRESPNGFVAIAGHYDVEAKRSRYLLENERYNQWINNGGTYYSDMDREFYSRGQFPGMRPSPSSVVPRPPPAGRHVAALRRDQFPQSNYARAAATSAMRSLPRGNPGEIADEANRSLRLALIIMGQQ